MRMPRVRREACTAAGGAGGASVGCWCCVESVVSGVSVLEFGKKDLRVGWLAGRWMRFARGVVGILLFEVVVGSVCWLMFVEERSVR